MKSSLILGVISAAIVAGPVLAQTTEERTTTVEHNKAHGTAAGAATGAVAGALVGGPIGAAVGGVAGATVGHSVAPPDRVRTYVTRQRVEPTRYSGDIKVGRRVDGDVAWRNIPGQPHYEWAYLGDKRVVVDRSTHDVVAVH
jgi:hypothetical protein